ncbi:MAG: hypothetical protein KDD15_15830 [Lewinella sp.]|nr:hypothetical protein [Lewinella sp.]
MNPSTDKMGLDRLQKIREELKVDIYDTDPDHPVEADPVECEEAEKMNNGLLIVAPPPFEDVEMPDPDFKIDGFKIENGRYHFIVNKKGWQHVSNFVIKPLYLLRDSRQPKRIMELTNIYEQSTVICCTVKALSSNSEFSALVEGRGNFVPSWVSYQFSAIKEYIYKFEYIAEEIAVLGHQPDTGFYAFSNGLFDGEVFYQVNEYGIVTADDQRFYLPAFSKVNEDAAQIYHNERKFIFQNGMAMFSTWSEQLTKVFGNKSILGICFVVASLFRDIVFSHANSFPLLFLFGPRGTGKSTYRTALHRLFGDYGPDDAIGLGSASSAKGFARKLAQVRNGLQPFEEYKNKIDPKLIEMLKNIYDGIGYERAQTSNDNRTHTTLINSAVILGGQEMPTKENALFSRVLLLTFDKTKFSKEEKAHFVELEKMISGGMGNVLLEIVQHRELVMKTYPVEFARIYSHLRKDPETQNMEERALTNVAAVLAPFKILSEVLEFPFDYKDAYRFIREAIKRQDRQMSKTNEVNQFWHVLDALEGQRFINQTHYDISDGILSVNMKLTYMVYCDQAGKQNLNLLDETTLKSYLSMQSYFVKQKNGRMTKTVRLGNTLSNKPVRCLQFRISGMQELEIDFLEMKN